jgi:sugar transferase (PEP-CTERM/EpsH1 system associated)
MDKPAILFITQLLPFPLDDGASLKAFYTLKYLSRKFDVTLVSFIRSKKELEYKNELDKICKKVHMQLIRRSFLLNLFHGISSLFTKKPFLIKRDYSRIMHRLIRNLINENNFKIVYADHLQMAQYCEFHGAVKILDEHNIESRIVEKFTKLEKNLFKKYLAAIEHKKLEKYEVNECRKFDLTLTVTKEDQKVLKDLGVKNVRCVPIGVDTNKFKAFPFNPEARDIVFLGTMYWPPNVDAVLWFYSQVFPLVKKNSPDSKFLIIGKRPPSAVERLSQDERIEVLGFVDDLSPFIKRCAAFVVPLRMGGGMRVKILSAMAWQLPVVSTSVGAEGIQVSDENNILIRNDPEKFAEAILDLLARKDFRGKISQNGRQLVKKTYDWDIIYKTLDQILKSNISSEREATAEIRRT